MPRAGFELVISTFEQPKTVLASDHLAIETSKVQLWLEIEYQEYDTYNVMNIDLTNDGK
jgi:hypothetical protein